MPLWVLVLPGVSIEDFERGTAVASLRCSGVLLIDVVSFSQYNNNK
ncbi:hypothetical protein [uncultured Selenomonas sp.]|nr:hypothetical protein [uncultured Selenomonas sp.]